MFHPEQVRWHQSSARHNVVVAGRRSFKTERAKRKLVIGSAHWPGALTLEGGRFFFGGPTFQQAKRIAWDDLKLMTKPFWERSPSESELVIYLRNGSEIHVIGMDKPSRIEGTMWHGGVLDEYADMRSETWAEHVQPVTADTGAWVDFIIVPEGRANHAFDLSEKARMLDEWDFFTWKSADVIRPEAIAAAKAILDEKTFRQEYEASFESSGSLVYYTFDDESVARHPFDPQAPTVMTWDFNRTDIKPMCCLLVQSVNGQPIGGSDTLYALTKEFVFPNTNTDEMCKAVDKWLKEQGFSGPLYVTGDSSGKRRESSASESDYKIIAYHFGNYPGYYRRNPVIKPTRLIEDRVASLNSLFRTMDGRRRLWVDPSCKNTIEDLRRTEWKENGVGLNDDHGRRTDESDALSYFPYNFHDISRRRPEYH